MYRKGSRKKKKTIQSVKIVKPFFFVKIILHCTSILFIVRNLVWIVEVLFYIKILASLTCDCKTWYIYKCKAWSITWEHIMYIIQLYHTYTGYFSRHITYLDVFIPSYQILWITGSIPNVLTSMRTYFKSPF